MDTDRSSPTVDILLNDRILILYTVGSVSQNVLAVSGWLRASARDLVDEVEPSATETGSSAVAENKPITYACHHRNKYSPCHQTISQFAFWSRDQQSKI